MKHILHFSYILCLAALVYAGTATTEAQTQKKNRARTEKTLSPQKRKKAGTRNNGTKSDPSSSDVQRQHNAALQEIKETRRKISENEKSIRSNLSELQKIGGDIETSRQQIATISGQVKKLNGDISTIESNITAEEGKLNHLRQEYLAIVKKMRLKRTSTSAMAFIFSSGSFNEAMRRIRYLKKFAAWRDRRTAAISQSVEALKKDRELLANAKNEKARALAKEERTRNTLITKQNQKDALVVRLRADGAALNDYLHRKQAEANALKGQVAQLIAREEAARAEQRRQAEEQQRRREAEEAARLQAMREEQEREEARKKELAMNEAKEKTEKNKEKSGKSKKKEKEKPSKKVETSKPDQSKNKDYAQARKRRPRGEKQKQSTPSKTERDTKQQTQPAGRTSSSSGFENAKGGLPRPVSGNFTVTSKFGPHSVPGLPDVVYDNPGIDASVSNGASALAVYPGRVSGVYILPGYNTVIIINHGNYYTVYGNIASPSVKQGDNIKQGQSLGKLAFDNEEKRTSIHFEVWHNRTKLNPLDWIR